MTVTQVPGSTFPDALAAALRRDPARPLVTFYDDRTGERVELSVTTYANWVAKTAGLVADELDVEPGDLVLVDLPTHWLGAVWLGALWSGGQVVTPEAAARDRAALVVCGPDRVATYAGPDSGRPVVALSLRPLGARFVDPLPAGVVDYGAVVLAQPDVFVPPDPPTPTHRAWEDAEGALTHRDLLTASTTPSVLGVGGRLLTDANPCSRAGLPTLLDPLLNEGGAVWVAHPDEDRWRGRYDEERATAELRSS